MPDETTITIKMTKTEALALSHIAYTGLRVTDALALVKNTSAAERGLRALKDAIPAPGRDGR